MKIKIVLLTVIISINMLAAIGKKPKKYDKSKYDKSYIIASTFLTSGSIVLFFNPLIGGSLLLAGGCLHLAKSVWLDSHPPKEKDPKPFR